MNLTKSLLLLALFLVMPNIEAHSQQSTAPIEKRGLIAALQHKELSSTELVDQIKVRGVAFQLDAAGETEIRQAGKYLGKKGLDELIAAIRKHEPKIAESPQILAAPKINGKVKYVRLASDPKTGYLYLAFYLDLANSGGRTKIRGFRATGTHEGQEAFNAQEVPCSDFRLVNDKGERRPLTLSMDEKKNKFLDDQSYREGWICLRTAEIILYADLHVHYGRIKDLKIFVIDGVNNEHPLEPYLRFPPLVFLGEEERQYGIGQILERIGNH